MTERTKEYQECIKYITENFDIQGIKSELAEPDDNYDEHHVSVDDFIEALKEVLFFKMDAFDPEHRAAAEYIGQEPDEIDERLYDNYGLRVFSYGNMEVAVGNKDNVYRATYRSIKDSLWAFNADFIAEHTQIGYKDWFINAIKSLQESKCESANDDIKEMIEDLDEFVNDAIDADGRGHFLSTWDGEENEVEIDGDTYFVYRVN